MSHAPHHILFVENGTGIGGATRCLQWLVPTCQEAGWRVSVAIGYPLAELEDACPDVTVIPLYDDAAYRRGQRIRRVGCIQDHPCGRLESIARFWSAAVLADLPVARRLAGYVRRQGVNLIHANNDLLVNRAALLAGRLAGVPTILHQRGWVHPSRINRLLERWCSRIIAVSDSVQRNLAQAGVSQDKVCRIYDGVDLSRYAAGQDGRHAVRARLGFGPEDEVIGMPAVLLPWKGHRVFLEALARIIRQRPRAKALLVGASPANAADLKPHLEQQARSLGLANRLTWVGHVDDMPAMYHAMDLVVHASVEPEPFGLVLLEALAAGRPLLAVDQAGPAEIVRHGVDGWLYPMGDATRLAQGLVTLLDDQPLRERLARAARDRAATFNPADTARAIRSVYQDVLQPASDKSRAPDLTDPANSPLPANPAP